MRLVVSGASILSGLVVVKMESSTRRQQHEGVITTSRLLSSFMIQCHLVIEQTFDVSLRTKPDRPLGPHQQYCKSCLTGRIIFVKTTTVTSVQTPWLRLTRATVLKYRAVVACQRVVHQDVAPRKPGPHASGPVARLNDSEEGMVCDLFRWRTFTQSRWRNAVDCVYIVVPE